MAVLPSSDAEHKIPTVGHRPINIAVCIPSHEKCDALFAYDLAQMTNLTLAFFHGAGLTEADVGIFMSVGTIVYKARQELMEVALNSGATHILWLDSDMRFPPDALLRLLRHDLPCVGINYSTRRTPPEFVALKTVPDIDDPDSEAGERLVTDESSTGLEEVDALGFGMVLMRTASFHLEELPPKPWFYYELAANGMQIGEDVYFCRRVLAPLGVRMFVDHDLSWECSHIGTFQYKCLHATLNEREEAV